MFLQNYRLFDLERLPWCGAGILLLSLSPIFFLLNLPSHEISPIFLSLPKGEEIFLDVKLPLRSDFSAFSFAGAEKQIAFSIDPPRPFAERSGSRLMVRLNQSKQVRRIEIPAKLDLEFDESGVLCFSPLSSLFWLEIDLENEKTVQARLFFSGSPEEVTEISSWAGTPQEAPIQAAEEFGVGTPFRELAEARWWGQDLFVSHYGDGAVVQKLELGPSTRPNGINLRLDQWLVYRKGQWQCAELVSDTGDPIARIRNSGSRGLELEGWDGTSHTRFLIPQIPSVPLKTKGEDLFSQLRVRSEKQISCTLDKQCLILRPGDWVLKADQRWKLLRKKEEREAFLNGEISGDLFVLDRVEAKGSVKSISGHYFSEARSQMGTIDYAVSSARGASLRKGKGKK